MNRSPIVRHIGTRNRTCDEDRMPRIVPRLRRQAKQLFHLAGTVAVWLLMLGSAHGQSLDQEAAHELLIAIPGYAGIRIVDAAGNGTNAAGVDFDYSADPGTFFAAAFGGGTIQPTDVLRFADIQIRAGWLWSVYVRATPIAYIGSRGGAGLGLGDIEVHRGASSGLSPDIGVFYSVDATWALDTNLQRIARGLFGTGGWKSLGFNGQDYLVRINGDEDPGEYRTRVTYLLASW